MRLRKHVKDSVRNTDENAHNTHGEKNSDVLAVALTDFVNFFFFVSALFFHVDIYFLWVLAVYHNNNNIEHTSNKMR